MSTGEEKRLGGIFVTPTVVLGNPMQNKYDGHLKHLYLQSYHNSILDD